MKKLYLHNAHSQCGANFITIQNQTIPGDYGNIDNELHSIYNSVTLLDRSYLGKILLSGKDSLDLLNRITTNDLQYLSIGTVCDTIFTTPGGQLVDYCRIINSGNDQYILIGSFYSSELLIDWINRFIILEDIEIKDVQDEYNWLTLIGPQCKLFLNLYSENPISDEDEAIWLRYEDISFAALKNSNYIVPAYNFCLEQNGAKKIFMSFQKSLAYLYGKLIGNSAFQILRIESGIPECETEINREYNPHEARLLNAVSFTKGSYTGQEIIARLDAYDKVQKYLMIIDLSEKLETDSVLDVYIEEELIGCLTSHAFNPVSGTSVGLGYIKKMYARDNDIYAEIEINGNRIPAVLRKPPQVY